MNPRSADFKPTPVRVGYILKMFPRLSETFILNEVLELERQHTDLQIFSLKRPADTVAHAQTSAVRSPVIYLPEKISQAPLRIMLAHGYVWRRNRREWRHMFRNALRRVRSRDDASSLEALSQACCLIREMRGVRHLHAHYANVPAKIALLVHRLTGLPYSITTHAKDIFQNDPFASLKLHERMGQARFVIANSRYSAEHIRSRVDGHTQVHIVYNGLDLQAFEPRAGEPVEPMILSVGRLVEKKGFPDLVAACQILKQRHVRFTCELIGTGGLSGALKEEIRCRGLADCVRMIGPLPQETLRTHYLRARIFVLPCRPAGDGDRDILPNVIKEAMAVGVPVVTTRLEGMDELIEDGVSGLLVAPGDVLGLAASMETLLGDLQLRHRLAAQGRRVVEERFDRRANVFQLRNLFEHELKPVVIPAAVPPNVVTTHEAPCLR